MACLRKSTYTAMRNRMYESGEGSLGGDLALFCGLEQDSGGCSSLSSKHSNQLVLSSKHPSCEEAKQFFVHFISSCQTLNPTLARKRDNLVSPKGNPPCYDHQTVPSFVCSCVNPSICVESKIAASACRPSFSQPTTPTLTLPCSMTVPHLLSRQTIRNENYWQRPAPLAHPVNAGIKKKNLGQPSFLLIQVKPRSIILALSSIRIHLGLR